MAGATDETVVILDLGYKPEAAISGAVLIATERTAWLTFNAVSLGADGLYSSAGTALLEFPDYHTTRFGYPNDEGIAAHPLSSKMLGGYEIYEVLNSSWIAEIGRDRSTQYRHFIATFHDSTFECIARGMRSELLEHPYATVFQLIGGKVLAEG